jgi:hypothetical protein
MACTQCTLQRAACETGLDILFNIGLKLPGDDSVVLLRLAEIYPDFVEKYAPNPAREKKHQEELMEAIDVYLAHIGFNGPYNQASREAMVHLMHIARMWVKEIAVPDEVFTSFGKLKVVSREE